MVLKNSYVENSDNISTREEYFRILKRAYSAVFSEKDEVQLCGREACQQLISLCLHGCPYGTFGNLENGMMDVENIQKYIRETGCLNM